MRSMTGKNNKCLKCGFLLATDFDDRCVVCGAIETITKANQAIALKPKYNTDLGHWIKKIETRIEIEAKAGNDEVCINTPDYLDIRPIILHLEAAGFMAFDLPSDVYNLHISWGKRCTATGFAMFLGLIYGIPTLFAVLMLCL